MMPIDKVTEAEAEHSTTSAIHPFDRFISEVYSRKDDGMFSLNPLAQERAAEEGEGAQSLSDNGEISPAESDKLRAQIIAHAHEAEQRAREATEKHKQIEAKYRQEQALRRLAEQRAEEIEEEYKQRLASAQAADLLRLETELTLAETEARLKQEAEALKLAETALSRVKEDAKVQSQSSALALEEAENYIAELEARVNELRWKAESNAARIAESETVIQNLEEMAAGAAPVAIALEKAERRVAELESGYRDIEDRAAVAESNALALEAELISTARNLGEKTAIAESTAIALEEARRRIVELEAGVREVEKKALAAGEAAREIELLMRAAEAREKEAQEKRETAEARLQIEVEMRVAADQKVQEIENKLKSDLEIDWIRFKADIEEAEAAVKAREEAIAQISAEEAGRDPEALIQQLYAQLEAERQARKENERRLLESGAGADNEKTKFNFDAERRLTEMEAVLKAANASRAEAERKLAEFAGGDTRAPAYYGFSTRDLAALNPSLSGWRLSMAIRLVRALSNKDKIQLVGYGAAAALLVAALIFLLYLGLAAN
jgi:hypothetical protein